MTDDEAHDADIAVIGLDRAAAVYDLPRAIGPDHEVMRVFQQTGIADRPAEIVAPCRPSEYRDAAGETLRRFISQDPPHPPGRPPCLTFLQPGLEAVPRARLAEIPGLDIRLSTEMTGLRRTRPARA